MVSPTQPRQLSVPSLTILSFLDFTLSLNHTLLTLNSPIVGLEVNFITTFQRVILLASEGKLSLNH